MDIQERYLDDYQAEKLDTEASFLEELVAEGELNTSLVLDLSPQTIQLVLNTSDVVQEAKEDVGAEIDDIVVSIFFSYFFFLSYPCKCFLSYCVYMYFFFMITTP